MSIMSDQFAVGGVPINEFMASGRVFFVRPSTGSDGNTGKTPGKALKTLAQAKILATTFGDTVYLVAESNTAASTTDYQSAALTWSTDGVHLIGLGSKPMVGHRARIAELSTVKTIEDLFTLSANNCYVRGLEIFQGVASSTATAARAMVVSGLRNRIENCQISGNGDTGGSTDDAGARSLADTGKENFYKNCYIGLDTVVRATQTTETAFTGTRTMLEDCVIDSWTSLSTFKAVTATSIDRWLILKNCILNAVQNITSAVAPTGAIINTTPNGTMIILDGGVFGYADVSTLADTKTLMLAHYGLSTASNFPGVGQSLAPS